MLWVKKVHLNNLKKWKPCFDKEDLLCEFTQDISMF